MGKANNDWFMSESLDIRCWGSGHFSYIFFLGVPMMILYVVGIPLGLFALLKSNEHLVRETDPVKAHQETPEMMERMIRFQSKYSFLYDGYKKKYHWWEVIVISRKVAFSALAVFFAFNYHAQGLFALAVCFICVVCHARALPFTARQMNILEFCSLMNTALTFFCGQFTFQDLDLNSNTVAQATYFALISNIIFIISVLSYLVWILLEEKQAKRKLAIIMAGSATHESANAIELESVPRSPTKTALQLPAHLRSASVMMGMDEMMDFTTMHKSDKPRPAVGDI
jgi:hypothetical protein